MNRIKIVKNLDQRKLHVLMDGKEILLISFDIIEQLMNMDNIDPINEIMAGFKHTVELENKMVDAGCFRELDAVLRDYFRPYYEKKREHG